jgi:hypothetical protein
MKADIKLCASSINVLTLPVSFLLGQGHLIDKCVQCHTAEFCVASVGNMFSTVHKVGWVVLCGWQS